LSITGARGGGAVPNSPAVARGDAAAGAARRPT